MLRRVFWLQCDSKLWDGISRSIDPKIVQDSKYLVADTSKICRLAVTPKGIYTCNIHLGCISILWLNKYYISNLWCHCGYVAVLVRYFCTIHEFRNKIGISLPMAKPQPREQSASARTKHVETRTPMWTSCPRGQELTGNIPNDFITMK